MRSSWLYFATRSLRAGAPVLIWPVPSATARSAIVASSVSPERWDMTARVAVLVREPHRLDRLGQRPDLVHLDEDRVGDAALDALAEPRGVRDEEVVADELDAIAEPTGRAPPSRPSRPPPFPSSMETIGIPVDDLRPEPRHLGRLDFSRPSKR